MSRALAVLGFVTLFGIATRNAVMLISHYDHLVTAEGEAWGRGAAVRGALGLLPLALASGDPDREIEGP